MRDCAEILSEWQETRPHADYAPAVQCPNFIDIDDAVAATAFDRVTPAELAYVLALIIACPAD